MSELSEYIKVFIRVRPMSGFDIQRIVQIISNHELALLSNVSAESIYKFNAIFSEQIHQDEVHNVILVPMIRDFIHGFNCTLFSYGTTRMDSINAIGSNVNLVSSTPLAPPVSTIPKSSPTVDDAMSALVSCTMYRLFEHLTQLELSSSVRISYLEILDEELFDLVQSNGAATLAMPLKIFETDKNQVYVNGLSETTVHSAAEALMIYRMAQKNARSLKSHTIFTISLQTKERPTIQMQENEGLFKFRKFCLVQLGSQGCEKKQARAKTVQSLTSFSRVVQALTNKQNHIPYRDSKLTRIMQDSLGGNAKTSILASIGSGSHSIDETTSALEFLSRIKGICNHPKVNERLDDARTLNEMALEIRKLIMDIDANRNKTGHFLTDEVYANYQSEMHSVRADSRRHKQELMLVNEEVTDLNCTVSNVNSSLFVKRKELAQLQSETTNKQKHLQVLSNVTQQRAKLINHHAANEQNITDKANEITNIVQTVLADKMKLDDCVTRYKSTDDRLIRIVQHFDVEMQEKLAKLKINSTNALQMIDVRLQNANELEKNFLRSASSLIELMKTKSFALLDRLEVNHTTEANKWSDIKTDLDDVLLTRLKSIDSDITQYKEYAHKLEEQSNTIEAYYEKIRELYQNHFRMEDELIADIQQRMKSHGEDVADQIKKLRLTVDQCSEVGSTIDSKMTEIYEQMREIVNQIQQNTAKIKNCVEPALQAAETKMQQTRHTIISSLDAHAIAVTEHKTLFKPLQLPNDFRTVQSELKCTAQQKANMQNETMEKIAVTVAAAMQSNQHHIDIVSADLLSKRDVIEPNEQMKSMRSDLKAKHADFEQKNKENVEIVNDVALVTEQMSQESADEIAAIRNQLMSFRELEFCVYQSSGETPAKRDYPTNVSLVATTPLDKIKQRFRDRLSQINGANPNVNYSFLAD